MKLFLGLFFLVFLHAISFSQTVFIYDGNCSATQSMSAACQKRREAIEEEQKRRAKNQESRNQIYPDMPTGDYAIKTKLSPELTNLLKLSKEEKSALENSLGKGKFEILKIWNNICGGKVFDASKADCAGKNEYPNASNYSFYLKDYKQVFASIFAANGFIYSYGNRPSLLVELGDVALDSVTIETKEAKAITEKIGNEVFEKLAKSDDATVEVNSVKATYLSKIEPNKTFLMKSSFTDSTRLAGFNNVETIFAFRILKMENDFVTLAWKKVYLKDGK